MTDDALHKLVDRASANQLRRAFEASVAYSHDVSACSLHGGPHLYSSTLTQRNRLGCLANDTESNPRLIAKGKSKTVAALLKALDLGCYEDLKLGVFDAFKITFDQDEVIVVHIAREQPTNCVADINVARFHEELKNAILYDAREGEQKKIDLGSFYAVPLAGLACLSVFYAFKH